MNLRRTGLVIIAVATLSVFGQGHDSFASPAAVDAATPAEVTAICEDLFGGVYDTPSSEPLAECQWDMAIIEANQSAWSNATGEGVTVGVIDSGIDATKPNASGESARRHSTLVGHVRRRLDSTRIVRRQGHRAGRGRNWCAPDGSHGGFINEREWGRSYRR
jgi:hypothetical protein